MEERAWTGPGGEREDRGAQSEKETALPECGEEACLSLMEEADLRRIREMETDAIRALHISQTLFESRILRRGLSKSPLEFRKVRFLKLLAEKEKVSLFFLWNLKAALPSLRQIEIEGPQGSWLSLDRDERINGYHFLVSGRDVKRVTQFYPQAQEGEYPDLFLPSVYPGKVCRAYRVHLMIPFFAHPEWYSHQEQACYRTWLKRYGRLFFVQAIEEQHGELLMQALREDGMHLGFTDEALSLFIDAAKEAGDLSLAQLLTEQREKAD